MLLRLEWGVGGKRGIGGQGEKVLHEISSLYFCFVSLFSFPVSGCYRCV